MIHIAAILFITYVVYIALRYGWLVSISDSFYISGGKPIFTLWIFALSFTLMAAVKGNWFMLGGAVCLGFVGAACGYEDDKMTKLTHSICAFSGILLLFIGLVIENYITGISGVASVLVVLIIVRKQTTKILWLEIASFVAFYIAYNLTQH